MARRASSDDQAKYRRPRAWDRAKAVVGGDVAEAMTRLDRCGIGCPRLLLAAAVHHFLSAGRDKQAAVLLAYMRSFSSPAAESLGPTESFEQMEAVDAEFRAAMRAVMGHPPGRGVG